MRRESQCESQSGLGSEKDGCFVKRKDKVAVECIGNETECGHEPQSPLVPSPLLPALLSHHTTPPFPSPFASHPRPFLVDPISTHSLIVLDRQIFRSACRRWLVLPDVCFSHQTSVGVCNDCYYPYLYLWGIRVPVATRLLPLPLPLPLPHAGRILKP